MIALILICQILLQVIIHYEHSTETQTLLCIALVFCVMFAQARWSAMRAEFDEMDMRLEKLEQKNNKKKK